MPQEESAYEKRLEKRRKSEDSNLYARVSVAAAASRAEGQRRLKAAGGLSILEWRVLWDLTEIGPCSIQTMATIQRADHSLFSRALRSMREKGYVKMYQDTEDKRRTLVAMTDKGRKLHKAAAPFMKSRRDRLRAAFSPEELAEFVRLIDKYEALIADLNKNPNFPQEQDND